MKVKELLSDKARWTQHVNARDKRFNPCTVESERAVSWCLLGAIDKCYPQDRYLADNIFKRLTSRIKASCPDIADCDGEVLINYNDTRTHAEVLSLVTELDI
jgi:hypothetical protein